MPKILVIDDDPIIRLYLKRTLQDKGYDVTLATNGKEGLELAKQIQPGLIICDWIMPLMDGLDVCRHVKADPSLSTTFFVLLSSQRGVADRVQGLNAGADEFLSKPIAGPELHARVQAGLRLYQLSQDLQRQKQMLEAEISEAVDYVRSLIPAPMREAKVSVDSCFIPSRHLGGDCFDYYWLDPDYLVLYLLDVSGHGFGSTLLSTAVLNLLRSRSLPDVNFYQPHDVLHALNDTFQMQVHNEKYFTIWYGVYNRVRRQLTYSSAGHPPAIMISEQNNGAGNSANPKVSRLKTPGLPIGMMPDATFQSDRYWVPEHSSLYVFSDGVFEVGQVKGGSWGLNEFIELLSTRNSQVNLDDILNLVLSYNNTDTFEDDLSLLRLTFD
jgi:sigma-B regulation protein RsbU (phosphoserine phosphatase)